MTLTPKQLQVGIDYFRLLANIKRRLMMESRLHELEVEKEKRESKGEK